MYPDDYENFEVITRTPGDGKQCASFSLKYKEDLICCPDCQSKIFSNYDTKTPRIIRDVLPSGKPVVLHIENKRCQCRKCKKVFSPNKYPNCIPEKARVSSDFLVAIADYAITYPGMSHEKIADVYGVSPTVVSQAVHDRIETTELKFISSLAPTKLLFVYPFKYDKNICYAICGTNTDNDAVLYDIRPQYIPDDVELYFSKIRFQGNDVPWASFTDFNEKIIHILREAKCLHSDDVEQELGIIKEILVNKIDEFSIPGKLNNKIEGSSQINDAVSELIRSLFGEDLRYINDEDYFSAPDTDFEETTEDSFHEKIESWFSGVEKRKSVKNHLQPLYDLLNCYTDMCKLIFVYTDEELAMDENLRFIKVFQRHNTTFEEMRHRILIHAENTEHIPMQRLLNSEYVGLGVHGMHIDLHKINAIYSENWQPADDGDIDDFPEFYKT